MSFLQYFEYYCALGELYVPIRVVYVDRLLQKDLIIIDFMDSKFAENRVSGTQNQYTDSDLHYMDSVFCV